MTFVGIIGVGCATSTYFFKYKELMAAVEYEPMGKPGKYVSPTNNYSINPSNFLSPEEQLDD